MEKTKLFLKIFNKAKKKYEKQTKRLAGEGWQENWQTLFATIMSAQTKDETTIPVAEELFNEHTLESIASSDPEDIKKIIRKVNYNNTKSRNLVKAARYLIENYDKKVPDTLDELIKIPGVGRKTANLVLAECFQKQAICVDTHVHKISNMFGIVKTKIPDETEQELMKIVPKRYWKEVNRIFVLWGKEKPRYDKDSLVALLEN